MAQITIRALAVALAALVVAVAAPAAALAQGAGDEQYADPFSDNGGGKNTTKQKSSSDGNGQADTRSQGTSPTTGTAPSTTTTTPSTSSLREADPPAKVSGPQLPYTGYPAWLAALAGAVLLASGTALRASLARRA
jgi:hypothetical protein